MASMATLAQLIDDLKSDAVVVRLGAIHALREQPLQHPVRPTQQHSSFFRAWRDRLGWRSSPLEQAMNEDQRAVRALIELLLDKSSVIDELGNTTTIGSQAAITLARIGEPAIGPLIEAVKVPALRREAMSTLWMMEQLHAGPAVARLLAAAVQPRTRDGALAALLYVIHGEVNSILRRNVGRAGTLERILADRDAGELVARELPRFKEFVSGLGGGRRTPEDFYDDEQNLILALIEVLPLLRREVDPKAQEIERAILALSLMGQAAVPAIVKVLEETWRVNTPQGFFAGQALKLIGGPAVEPLVKLLDELVEKIPNDFVVGHRSNQAKAFRTVANILVEIGDSRATPVLVNALSNETISSVSLEALGKIGDETALFPLLALAEGDYHIRLPADVAEAIRQNPRLVHRLEAIGANADRLLCSQCLARFEQRSVERITYWACRLCHRASTALEDIAKVIMVIEPEGTASANARFDDRGVQVHKESRTVRLHWPQAKELCDFDEVWIGDALDADVEEFVLHARNDPDDWRRDHYASVRIMVSSSHVLSQSKLNLLKDTFQEVVVGPPDGHQR